MSADALERVRMCLAEAGEPRDIWLTTDPHGRPQITGWAPAPPEPVLWKARELAGFSLPMCKRCHEVWSLAEVPADWPCVATGRLVEDCGAVR